MSKKLTVKKVCKKMIKMWGTLAASGAMYKSSIVGAADFYNSCPACEYVAQRVNKEVTRNPSFIHLYTGVVCSVACRLYCPFWGKWPDEVDGGFVNSCCHKNSTYSQWSVTCDKATREESAGTIVDMAKKRLKEEKRRLKRERSK